MPWTTPETFTAGQTLTAASMNVISENTRVLRGTRYGIARRSSSSITINGTGWANVDTGLDITINADAGDVIEATFFALVDNGATDIYIDAVTVVSGSPVNSFGAGGSINAAGYGVLGWGAVGSTFTFTGCSSTYTLAAGDVSSSQVVIRLRARTQTATNRSLVCDANRVIQFYAKNLGPVVTS